LVKLGQVVNVRSGYAFKSGDWTETGVPVVKIANVKSGRLEMSSCSYVSPSVAASCGEFQLIEDDIVIAMTGYIGDVAKVRPVDLPCVLNQRVGKFTIIDSQRLDKGYLFAFLSWQETRTAIESLGYGSAQPNVSPSLIHSVSIPLPPLPEQRRIAKILGDLDDKIELNRKMNETLEQMARALFKSWFIDFDPVRAKMEGRQPPGMDADTAALFPSRLVESELGLIPEGWKVKALGDVVECLGGGTPSTKEGLYWNGGTINWATPKDLSSLQAPLLTATERSITDAGLARVASGILPARTLLMSSRAPVGYLAISTIPVAINQGFIAMPESSIMPSIYMLHWCNANMTEIQGRASGTTFAELSKSNFRQMRLLLPSGQLLQIFSRMVSDYYNQIETNIHQSRTLASLRDTLLPQLMRGEGGQQQTNIGVSRTMHKVIALFNHKGGVSKTTTTFNLGWMLAEKGKRVVMVDTDPQCNLTGLILGESLDEFYINNPTRNIYAALAPAFLSQPREIIAVDCVEVPGRPGLLLLPGHVNLSSYEVTLGIAQELHGSIQTLQNLPGSFNFLMTKIAEASNADFVLIDMSPSLGSINQNVLASSDGFLVPTSPDYFSLMAIDSLSEVLPRWADWARRAHSNETLRTAAYPFRELHLKFLGTIVQNFRPRLGDATVGFQSWIDKIDDAVRERLFPELRKCLLTLPEQAYTEAGNSSPESYCLARIPNFNTLAATSQSHRTPVFALTDQMLGHVGTVLEQDRAKRNQFHELFSLIAERVIDLTAHD
jgi:restriction endonuclease S subunit/cellulose biosynthesis protein BcsQ